MSLFDASGGEMFGDALRAHRLGSGLTQEELAGRAGVAVRTVRAIESGRIGRPRPATVRLLAEALALGVAERDRLNEAAWPECVSGSGRRANAPAAGPAAPAQLAPDVVGFAGRAGPLRVLTESILGTGRRGDAPDARGITVVSGTAGVGKSALALRWAHRAAHLFPGGQLYVDLRGHGPDPAREPAGVLVEFLLALGVPDALIPPDLTGRTALFRTVLATRRVLVVLDGARDADQVRPLLPGSAGSPALVTSRNRLPGLVAAEGAALVLAEPLTAMEARQLLAARLGAERVAAEPEPVDHIVELCAGLPLALGIVAALAVCRPTVPLNVLAARLGDRAGQLDVLTTGDPATDLRTALSGSYRALSPAAGRVFRRLGTHLAQRATVDFGVHAAATLAGLPPARTESLLAELTCANLLTEDLPGRYRMHRLLRAYGAELDAALAPALTS